ncbi:hypothetical protein AMECASPLE_030036 [Ameca splendens]|uniref:Uncharacterized protein n=1 Tax=Ameca splendens TaxID=208324 RepID=A0ABV0YH07_9TELE
MMTFICSQQDQQLEFSCFNSEFEMFHQIYPMVMVNVMFRRQNTCNCFPTHCCSILEINKSFLCIWQVLTFITSRGVFFSFGQKSSLLRAESLGGIMSTHKSNLFVVPPRFCFTNLHV